MIVALIPARGGSKGIHKKNLASLAGKPLISYVIDAAKDSMIDEVWVSTDNDEIAYFSKGIGAKVLKRPDELAQDDSSTEEVMLHFAEHVKFDTLILLQPTSPLITGYDIDNGLKLYQSKGYDSVISVIDSGDILLWDKISKRPINYNVYDRGRRQTRDSTYIIETGGFYITSREALLDTKCRCSGNIGFSFIDFWKSFEVDTINDLRMIEKLLTK